MFSLFTLIRSGILSLLLNDYIKRTFPEEHEIIVINLSLKCIYLFSKCQIIRLKLKNQIKDFIETNPYLNKIVHEIYKKEITNEICQIKNTSIYIKYFTDFSNIEFENDKNSFYIFSDNINAINNCVNKVIFHTQPFIPNYEVSNVTFILLELKFKENAYKISLKNNEFNFYIVNNILDKKFFIYYLYNYQVCNLTEDDVNNITKFDIKLIDQDVNVRELEITDDKFIIIKKDEYIY
jgi:hypothetical protein